ncbi:unnamed protein product [Rotaria sp. Silwood1]|nr:unnamed protein product [Rotaria sp. Silwood1]
MPLTHPNITIILAYIVIGLALSAIIFIVLSISTTHWIHTIHMRAGFWKLCHLQPLACFHSVLRSPAALSLTGLFLIVIDEIFDPDQYLVFNSFMSSSRSSLNNQESDNKDLSIDMSTKLLNKISGLSSSTILLSDSPSSLKESGQTAVNKRVVKSCFFSTVIFSINFISSILVINLAKWIYVKHHFPNLTLTTLNFFVTFFLLIACMQAKVFTYAKLPIFNMIPVSACFGGFIAFSNLSLQYNTVGTYQLIKLQVTPTVMVISWLFFKAHYPLPIVISFIPVFVGTLISTYYDLQLNVFGLFCAVTSVVFTAMYQILVEYYQKAYNCDSLQLLFYQAPLSGLLLLFFVPFFEPISDLDKFMTTDIIFLILLCGVVAFFVNFSIFWVIGNLSAVAYNMIGHSKTLLIIFIGSFIFHEPLNQRQIFGLCFTMLGVFLYTYFKYIRKADK